MKLGVSVVLGGTAALAFASCTFCPPYPCTAPAAALQIEVTPAGKAASVGGLVVEVSGAKNGFATCSAWSSCDVVDGGLDCRDIATHCAMYGPAGTYDLQFSATGYQTVTRSVTVTGDPPAQCCDHGPNTVSLNVQLEPSA